MPLPIVLETDGHVTLLKWHRGRRNLTDTPFAGSRILQGMTAGASVEIDLQIHGEGGMVVLHDPLLEQSTTGVGPVAATPSAGFAGVNLKTKDGADSGEAVMLLDRLTQLIASRPIGRTALLQLDFKDRLADFHDNTVDAFTRAVGPVARHMILSGGDADAVKTLSTGLPDLAIGYDPCLYGAMERVLESGNFSGFVDDALKAAPWASMIYLHVDLILEADRTGFDMIGAFHAADKTVDAWTIHTVNESTRSKIARLLELKADQITTDDADGLFAAFG
ncbi:glycerophosphodiester phosphodiesterase [Martelella alba]|uniref:Glycerophosphodiester phosphodiesterase n=1 Tax=Martelella alba TaxID=2590451 RepID=A0A506UFH2_9HYPH|nr:glycerophosphodiester phosphodiesterase family protein [Martelella alba]TPW32538.1 glycerophosphodiester phosphodiesterase [Martelella alba]